MRLTFVEARARGEYVFKLVLILYFNP